jgi:hypothetical protein
LADQRSDRPARRRDHHGFIGLRLADHAHAAVGGEPRHAEHAQTGRHRCCGGIKLAQVRPISASAVGERVCAPPGRREHDVTFGIVGMFRDEDPRNGFATHDVAEPDWARIGFPIIHPAAHVRVERQVMSFEQQLTGSRRRDRSFLQAEVGQLRPALGAGGEDDLAGSHVDISRKGFRAPSASTRWYRSAAFAAAKIASVTGGTMAEVGDPLVRPVGEVQQGALLDLARLAIALAQQDGRG